MSHVPTVLKSDKSVFDKMLPVDDSAETLTIPCSLITEYQRKKAEMPFLRVSDLLLLCVVLNHDADSLLYII